MRVKDRTRLDAVKQMFYGFRDQSTTFTNTHQLGLVSYSSQATVHTAPTTNYSVFEDVIDDLEPSGCTAIYEAITTACRLLQQASKPYPNADLRVIVLSDGQNNGHSVTANDALQALSDLGCVCDALIVGDKADDDLRRLVSATEGECFQILGLADAYETLESRAVVSLEARRNGAPKPDIKERQKKIPKTLAACKVAKARVGALQTPRTLQKPAVFGPLCNTVLAKATGKGGKHKRLHQELNKMLSGALAPGFYVYPGVDDQGGISTLKVLMHCSATPYRNKVFRLLVAIPETYPFSAPRVSFDTPVYHYAVSTTGGVCLPICSDSWSPAKTINDVLVQLKDLITEHEQYDPTAEYSQRSWLSELLRVDKDQYYKEAHEHAEQHALSPPCGADGADVNMTAQTMEVLLQ